MDVQCWTSVLRYIIILFIYNHIDLLNLLQSNDAQNKKDFDFFIAQLKLFSRVCKVSNCKEPTYP